MPQSSGPPAERARKAQTAVLQAVQRDATQAAIAAAMGVSASTLSRLINDHLEHFTTMLAHAGLKVVPASHRCVSAETYEFLTSTHARVMRTAPELIWETDE